jgi:integrase
MRNPNQYGSVYKLSGRRRCPWAARITAGWETAVAVKGKYAGQEVRRQKYHYIGYYETKEEAMDALTLYRKGYITPKSDLTLGELYQEWSDGKYARINDYTIRNYKAAWSRLEPLKHHRFADLRTKHWQEIIDDATVQLSALKKMRTVISQLYGYAMQNDIAKTNYAKFLILPRAEKIDKLIFSDIEIKKLEDNIDRPGVDTIVFLIYTGFRISELLSLTRFNVDLDREIITGGIKSEAGKNRIVPIHYKIMPIVKKHLARDGQRLFCRDNGEPLKDDKYRRKIYYPALESLGIPKKAPHCCRHTFATLMARASVDPLLTQRIIGHSNYAFTADVYSHPRIEDLKNAINKI